MRQKVKYGDLAVGDLLSDYPRPGFGAPVFMKLKDGVVSVHCEHWLGRVWTNCYKGSDEVYKVSREGVDEVLSRT